MITFWIFVGIIIAFGLIGIVNFVFAKYAMAMRDDTRKFNQEALEHWERLEVIWQDIADTLRLSPHHIVVDDIHHKCDG